MSRDPNQTGETGASQEQVWAKDRQSLHRVAFALSSGQSAVLSASSLKMSPAESASLRYYSS